jgi:glycosyltransferase involved in cell wall biosynthesis
MQTKKLNKALSIIIPFLNEGNEVENTLESIYLHSNDNIEVIIINDASTDDFDYQSVAKKYNVHYIVNEERMGVAASRDKGVNLCSTPYFLLLDAHMRFYDHQWIDKIIDQLEKDSRAVLCCQSKSLCVEKREVVEDKAPSKTYGAYIDFHNHKNLLGAVWTRLEYPGNSNSDTAPIACILGAGYACSKRYWQYLKGLEGLICYGSDETYFSLKVWLEGGKCLLLKNVIIGHIYRTQFPYPVEFLHTLYNRLFIAELLLPLTLKKRVFAQTKMSHSVIYNQIVLLLKKNEEQIAALKSYYKEILKNDFNQILHLNNLVCIQKYQIENKDEILKKIAHSLIINGIKISNLGLLMGRMSIVIFLFHYAEYLQETLYKELAEAILDNLLEELRADQSLSFLSGLCGIGWSIEYLCQNGFVEGDMNEMLKEIDEKITEINPLKIRDFSLHYGLGGIVHYLLARLYTIDQEQIHNPYGKSFLKNVYFKCKSIIKKQMDCDSMDVFIKFVTYYELHTPIEKLSLYDIACLPENYQIENYTPGLYGSAGIGLYLILISHETSM